MVFPWITFQNLMMAAQPTRTLDQLQQPGDSSGVHASERPTNVAGWRTKLESAGVVMHPEIEELIRSHVELRDRSALVERRMGAMQAALDRLPIGVFILDNNGLLAHNRVASEVIDSGAATFSGGSLVWNSATAHSAISQAVEGARRDIKALQAVRVEHENGVWLVMTTAAGPLWPDTVLMVVSNPDRPLPANADVFRAHFGFTPTEARVATHLVMGLTPREVAEHLGVGVETTRTHVKHILAKVGCHRQVDVVRKLVTGPIVFA